MNRLVLTFTLGIFALACSDDSGPDNTKKDGGGGGADTGVTADKGATTDKGAVADKGPVADKGAVADKAMTADQAATADKGSTGADGTASSGFGATVWPILKASCANGYCHGGGAGGLTMKDEASTYAALVGVKSKGCSTMNYVTASDLTNSYLIQKLEGKGSCFMGGKMPKGGSLTAAQITAIKGWITAGAKK